jgi:hypothetical protein
LLLPWLIFLPLRILAQLAVTIVFFVKGGDYAEAITEALEDNSGGSVSLDAFSGNEAMFMIQGGYILAQSLLFIYFFLVVYSLYIEMRNQLAARQQPGQPLGFLGTAYAPGSTNQQGIQNDILTILLQCTLSLVPISTRKNALATIF